MPLAIFMLEIVQRYMQEAGVSQRVSGPSNMVARVHMSLKAVGLILLYLTLQEAAQ